ncbi:hypothetical protein [Candidatus Rhabdochlamydia porcellionis]|jgi:hypothetical protein|uniref:Uncharacterized protein n=1 Tax=Candidatus Rhabdochlamydia porcellionis TaxID=225148 RepID=A0ABX8YYH6_9BACT|nr:hypothetical protein [Candidatus Rhabdochlamydia porcellionis]QZA58371.1 hypothetical protein RHAB15C_0000244 [Candidatus Rhabdochlamydia porcellionis]
MSKVGKIPNPLNPANDPKKDKSRLDSNQFREKFDYRKKEETSSGSNRQRYAPEEEEQTPKTPTPDSIFKSSSSRKNSFRVKKNIDASHKKITPSSEKEMQKKSAEEISVEKKLEEKQTEEKSIKKKVILTNPTPEAPPKISKSSLSKQTPLTIKPKEKKKEETSTSFEPLANIQPNQPNYQPSVLPTGSAFSSYQISQLFDRMAGVMTVMELSGTTETELTLSGEEFASSVFYGARITITEYSTAPKAFNVQLSANPEAVALFQGNMPNLLANFASGNYAFSIHRLETNVEERPLFKRKESFGSDQQPMQGDS